MKQPNAMWCARTATGSGRGSAIRRDHPAAPGASRYLDRKRTKRRRQATILDRCRAVPCSDCGERYPPCAMDFDHRDPSTKRAAVTRMIGRAGTQRLLDEIAKCDIVCANCHRLRTPKTFGSDGAGVAQLVERQPSKLHVAGSSPVSRSNPPDSYESAACPCAVVASSVIGPSGSRPTISPRASSTTMTAAS